MSTPSPSQEQNKSYIGKVKRYITRKQFGFITRLDDKKEFFVHYSSIKANCPRIRLFDNEYVEFIPDLDSTDNKLLPNVKSVYGIQGFTLHCEDLHNQHLKRKQNNDKKNNKNNYKKSTPINKETTTSTHTTPTPTTTTKDTVATNLNNV